MGYHQIPVRVADRPKTAFITHEGLSGFNVMQFGLCYDFVKKFWTFSGIFLEILPNNIEKVRWKIYTGEQNPLKLANLLKI